MEVSGIVTGISRGERDFPNIWIDSKLVEFGNAGYKVEDVIQRGDSIVKRRDTYDLLIFRNNRLKSIEKIVL